jgi:RimJ/RimL family protein N-acetyltransferase
VTVGPTIVRIATLEDAIQVGEAHGSAWEEGYSALFAPEDLAELAKARRSLWTHIFADSSFDFESMLVAEQAGEVVGYSHFGRNTDIEAEGEVFGFYAHPRVWGTGVSTAMMDASLVRLRSRSLHRVVLWTLEGAGRARGFYEKSGFTPTGRKRTGTVFPTESEVSEVEYSFSSRTDVVP